jgi:plastocyanin
VTGGSYARQTIAFDAASSGSISNNAAISFTGMPACTVVGVEIWDNAGTPKRLAYGPLTASRTVSAGDTVQFASSSVTLSLS